MYQIVSVFSVANYTTCFEDELGNLSSSANFRLSLNFHCSFGDNRFSTSTGIGI